MEKGKVLWSKLVQKEKRQRDWLSTQQPKGKDKEKGRLHIPGYGTKANCGVCFQR